MSVQKIKSIVIAALALIKILFLTFIVIDRVSASTLRTRELAQLSSLYSEAGLTLDVQRAPLELELPSLTASRDNGVESAIASALIGDCSASDMGGGIFSYSSASGEAVFRSGGELSASVSGSAVSIDGERDVKKLLKRLDISPYSIDATDSGWLVCQKAGGVPVFNCVLELTSDGGALSGASGRLITGLSESDYDGELYSCVTALVRFLSAVKRGEAACASVNAVTGGFILNSSVFGDWLLEPVWRLTTDTGEYYISGLTGTLL